MAEMNLKKIMVIILCSTLLVGCKTMEHVEENNKRNASMFVTIEDNTLFRVVYNKYTKVMYAVSIGGYNGGNVTLLVNADGTPMLYEPESEDNE